MLRVSFLAKMSVAIVLALAAIPTAAAAAAVDYFLKIDGVPGEAKDPGHTDWIEVSSFSFGVARGVSVPGARGAEAGRAVHDISITKKTDRASPKLFEMAATGRHIPKVVLQVRRGGGYLTYVLEDVMISSVRRSSGGDRPSESVTLNFARMTTQSGPAVERAPGVTPQAERPYRPQ
jgi:type VI secretion system Hcp family effector